MDEFTVILRDACGAKTEIPVTVVVHVEDKMPPEIIRPARNRTVECDGKGNQAELFSWLADQAGTLAFDNCCQITWRHRVDKYVPSCGGSGYWQVTFIVTDCAGNSSSTSATFTIADTSPPTWDQPMPEDITVECHSVPLSPVVAASDSCAGKLPVAFREERIAGPCPHTYTLVRTWETTDGCHRVSHTQRIEVQDTTPPTLMAPANMDLGCNPDDTSPVATGWAMATDNCDPSPTVTYADSVSTVGCVTTITRTWSAADACGNTSHCRQVITYTLDTVPPTIHCPGSVYQQSTQPPGTWVWVDFPIEATDNCDSPTVTCVPSGGWFEVGTTTFASTSCTARDACGNETSQECTFPVTVEFICPPLIARPDSADAPGYVWIPVLANDSGYGLRIVSVSPPRCGRAWISGDGIFYTTMGWSPGCPPPQRGMEETFSYTVQDACGNISWASVTVTITCDVCPLSLPPGG